MTETKPVIMLYTLQAFNASQKGQVSVPAHIEVELLSDVHWYWWFIRIPKTKREGFVPAELLELPCERQARLNSLMNVRMSHSPLIEVSKVTKAKKHVRFNYELSFSDGLKSNILEPMLEQNTFHSFTPEDVHGHISGTLLPVVV